MPDDHIAQPAVASQWRRARKFAAKRPTKRRKKAGVSSVTRSDAAKPFSDDTLVVDLAEGDT